MDNLIFLAALGTVLIVLLRWAFTRLPAENWQFMAAIPRTRQSNGSWSAFNLTYYGFFSAIAYTAASALLLIMLGALQVPAWQTLLMTGATLAVCLPAAQLLAWLVEKKKHAFTVGGAAFTGILLAPWLLLGINQTLSRLGLAPIPVLPALAALSVAYCFGEGLGRLACISFGCCYGKPLRDCSPIIRWLFAGMPFVFEGETKKIAYHHQLTGTAVFPVQAVTSLVCLTLGLTGLGLLLTGSMATALALTLAGSQLWRLMSEQWRIDYRGPQNRWRLSSYQVMALTGAIYTIPMIWFFGNEPAYSPILQDGLRGIWAPGTLLFLQGLFLLIIFHVGRSYVTEANIRFTVRQEHI